MLPDFIQKKLQHYDAQILNRQRQTIGKRKSNNIFVENKWLINFSHNDYLNLNQHPLIKIAMIDAIQKYGSGSTGSPMMSGYTQLHHVLEETFSAFTKREKAILFNSGYHANIGVLSVLANKKSTVLIDKEAHASIIDAAQLSGATLKRFRHNDTAHATFLMKNIKTSSSLIITESIFSMRGDLAPIPQLATLAQQHQTILMVDDAHGAGILGEHGAGIGELHASAQIDCLITPLGKSFASMGAIISGKKELINALLQFARTYHYSTALPPAAVAATLAALQIIRDENWRRQKLNALIHFFINETNKRNIPLLSQEITPIKFIRIESNHLALQLQYALMQEGFYVTAIRPPSIPKKNTGLRISLNCALTEENIMNFLDAFQQNYFVLTRRE